MTAENDSGATPESPIRTMKKDLGRWIVTVAILMVAVAATVSTLLTLLVVSLADTDEGVEASQTAILEPVATVAAEEPVAVDPPANSSEMEMDSRPEPPVMEYGQFPEPESSEMLLMMLFMMMAMADQEADSPPWSDYGYQEECYHESCVYGTEPGYHEYGQFPEPESSEMLLMMLFMMMAMADQEADSPPWSDYGYQEECYHESCMDYPEPYYEYGDDDYAEEEYYEYEYEYEDDDSQYQTEGDFYGMPPLPAGGWDPETLALYEELVELLSHNLSGGGSG